jgi:FtsH-binding integral membrane protein
MSPLIIIYFAITILDHFQIINFCFIGIVLYHAFKSNTKKVIRSSIAFALSIFIIIAIPSGIVVIVHPEIKGKDAEILKEVEEWL